MPAHRFVMGQRGTHAVPHFPNLISTGEYEIGSALTVAYGKPLYLIRTADPVSDRVVAEGGFSGQMLGGTRLLEIRPELDLNDRLEKVTAHE